MQEQIKQHQVREMHKYVLGLVGVFLLIAGTYPIAFIRVSKSEKFTGFHVKSLTVEGKLENSSAELVALKPTVNQPGGQVAINSNLSGAADTSRSAQTVNPTIANNSSGQPFINGSTDNNARLEEVMVNSTNAIEEISEPTQIKELNQKVYDRIAQVWQAGHSLKQRLVYRVTVTDDGAIASYEPLVQPALDYLEETPLPKLLQSSISSSTGSEVKTVANKAIGKFKVVFTRQGILEVSPWHGWKR